MNSNMNRCVNESEIIVTNKEWENGTKEKGNKEKQTKSP